MNKTLLKRLRRHGANGFEIGDEALKEIERLRLALEEISNPEKLPSHGDPTVLRDHALKALNTKPKPEST